MSAVPTPWVLTKHAYVRMTSMGMTRADVLVVIDQPEVTYHSETGSHFTAMRAGVAVIFQPSTRLVISVAPRDGGDRPKLCSRQVAKMMSDTAADLYRSLA